MSWRGILKGIATKTGDATAVRNVRSFSGRVERDNISSDCRLSLVDGRSFAPESTYFSVRLVEMRLSESGRYGLELLPMCCCFLKFTYGGSQRSVPYVLGHDTITAGLGTGVSANASRRITFRDMYVVRNVPVKADNLAMYMSFCRAKSSGFARGLLGLFADAAGALAGPVGSGVIRVGTDLSGRLTGLLGADDVETRFGSMSGNALDRSGYYVHAGVPAGAISADELEMRDGQLLRRASSGSETIDDVDYLVIAMECLTTLVSADFGMVSTLPFHARWTSARSQILAGNQAAAAEELTKLLIEVVASPDVTEADRIGLVASYRGAFDEWSKIKAGATLMGSDDGPRANLLRLADGSAGRTGEVADIAAAGLSSGYLDHLKDAGTLPDFNAEEQLAEVDKTLLSGGAAKVVERLNGDPLLEAHLGRAAPAIMSSLLPPL